MSALFALPTDLLHLVIREWLLTKDLMGFDSACSCSVRWSYLSLTRDPVFVVPKVTLALEASFTVFVSWVNLRSAKLGELAIHLTHLKACAGITFYSLRTLHTLTIQAWVDADEPFITSQFATLVKLSPGLTSLSLAGIDHVEGNSHLVFLTALPNLKLKHIQLDRSFNHQLSEWANSCVHLHQFVCRYGADLRTTNLGVRAISEETMRFICTVCTRVENLEFACANLSSEALLTYLASSYLPCLEVLDIFDYRYVLEDNTLIDIAKNHPKLVSLDIIWESDVHGPGLTMASCVAILSYCPAMNWLNSYAYQYDQERHSLLLRGQLIEPVSSMPINLLSFNRPLLSMQPECLEGFSTQSMISMLTLVEACGKHQADLEISLKFDVDDKELCQMMVFCGRLESLQISGGILTDACLIAIGEHCKCLRTLGISPDLADFTVVGWNKLFRAIGKELTTLDFLGRILIDGVLDVIEATCPKLVELRLRSPHTSVLQELIDSWISRNRMPTCNAFTVMASF